MEDKSYGALKGHLLCYLCGIWNSSLAHMPVACFLILFYDG